jgi:hypothetical protein
VAAAYRKRGFGVEAFWIKRTRGRKCKLLAEVGEIELRPPRLTEAKFIDNS